MIIRDAKTKTVTIFIEEGRELIMSEKEFTEIENLIKNPPPLVRIKVPRGKG